MQAWQSLVLTGRRQWLETEYKPIQRVGNWQEAGPKQAQVPSLLPERFQSGGQCRGCWCLQSSARCQHCGCCPRYPRCPRYSCHLLQGAEAQRLESVLLTADWQLASAR